MKTILNYSVTLFIRLNNKCNVKKKEQILLYLKKYNITTNKNYLLRVIHDSEKRSLFFGNLEN